MPDVNVLADQVFAAVESYLARSLGTFEKRLSDLVAAKITELPKPQDGKDGEAGKDAPTFDLAEVAEAAASKVFIDPELIKNIVREQFAEITVPKDGEPGKDGAPGKDADPAAVDGLTAELAGLRVSFDTGFEEMAQRFAGLPTPKDGEAGTPGKDAAIDYDRIGDAIKSIVAQAVAEIPKPADGKDADPDAIREMIAAEVDAIPKSPTSFMVDDAGELVAVYPNGATKAVGNVRGKDGIRGASIMDGHIDNGQLVLRMSDGRIINAGTVAGKDGKDGEGKPGLPGRDANEIRILPAIDETKSYPEGTCALYRGGMIRAERTTDPITGDLVASGWRVALEGIADESEQELDEGRILERTTVYTSGRVFTRSTQSKALIYHGTWAEADFVRGDTVTWDGSLWHCERATRGRPGGLDSTGDWKLCVKRGSPGKDGQTVKGDPGKDGRPGRDLTQLGFDGGKH